MNVMIVLGTRPEIIKMAPIIRELRTRRRRFSLVHTGQHYSYEMDRTFFKSLGLPAATVNLNVGSGTHGAQTAKILPRIEQVLLELKPDVVLVEGDTNSVMAGALAAVKCHIPVGHVEAGLRSFDRRMPEEINRIVADHVASFLYAPTPLAARQLRKEGIAVGKILVTGNTVVDSLDWIKKNPALAATVRSLGFSPGRFLLTTIHREENVEDRRRLAGIVDGLHRVARHFDMPVVFPAHPRTKGRLNRWGLENSLKLKNIRLLPPLDALPFMALQTHARLVLTDSGGVQEESCILRVPCVTLRDNTERPETVAVGANLLAGADPGKILAASVRMSNRARSWKNPFGDGRSGRRIVDHLSSIFH